MQRRDIVSAGADEPEGLRVMSVFMSGDRSDAGGEVATERGQVLEAIAVHGSESAFVVENKSPASLRSRRLRRPVDRETTARGYRRVANASQIRPNNPRRAARLRALWAISPVGVRVFLGALGSPPAPPAPDVFRVGGRRPELVGAGL